MEDLPYGISDQDLELVEASFDDMLKAGAKSRTASREVAGYENSAAIRDISESNDYYENAKDDIAQIEGVLLREWLSKLVDLSIQGNWELEDAAVASTAKDKNRYLAAAREAEQTRADLKEHLTNSFAQRLSKNEDFVKLIRRLQGQE